ncbi:helix-turn-helix domain-containing protein [Paenibacillus silviterrae]|uniref:helix-turn-helix domain-containing protein n=1 Tax=Paenibacillus silviterrae TaxID=3242194 RepID=UPI0032B2EEE6
MSKKLSVFERMVLFGCLLSIIPVIIIGFFSYLKSSDAIQREVNDSSIHIMRQTNGNIERVLITLDHTLNSVISSSTFQEAMDRRLTFYDFQLYNTLRREMSLLQSPDRKVTDVVLVNTSHNWLMNNSGLYPLDTWEQKDEITNLMSLPHHSQWVVHEKGQLGSKDTLSYGCKNTITLVKKLPLQAFDKKGLILAHIPSCTLASMLTSNASQHVMILDQNMNIVVHPDENQVGHALWETGFLSESQKDLLDHEIGQFETKTAKGLFTATYVRSQFNGWTYLSFTENDLITKEARDIGWFTFFVCLLIIGASVVTVWFGTRRMYRPIGSLINAIEDRLPSQPGKPKDEFQIISEHIEQLFESNTSLKTELQQNTQVVRTSFLQKIFTGNIKLSELEERLSLYGFDEQIAGWKQMEVLTLQIDMLESTRFTSKDLDLLLFAVNNILEETIPADHRFSPVLLDQTQVTLIGAGDITSGQFRELVDDWTEAVRHNIRTYLDLDVSIGISLPFQDISKAARGYREGLEALKQRLTLGTGIIIRYAYINEGKHTIIQTFPQQLENDLIDAVKLAEEEKALSLLKQWMKEVFQKERSPQQYQVSLMRLLNDLLIVMQEAGISLAQIQQNEDSLYEELLQIYVGDEIEKWFRTRLILPLIGVFRDRSESQYRNLSEELIDLIHRYYDTDLTLEECASKLHYNTFYLSSVFKKETNMSFSEYLTMYRFNMAKKWLKETDMTVKDIAQKLGYNNPQNFIRSFRKQEDMTPGQYRTKYGTGEEK